MAVESLPIREVRNLCIRLEGFLCVGRCRDTDCLVAGSVVLGRIGSDCHGCCGAPNYVAN